MTPASSGSARSAVTSLTISAPKAIARRATSALVVSMEIGTPPSRRSRTGTTRRSSSSVETPSEPGRVDSPPTSTIAAPSSIMRRAAAAAMSASRCTPPSENESGVTFTTPMTDGRGKRCSIGITCGSLHEVARIRRLRESCSRVAQKAGLLWACDVLRGDGEVVQCDADVHVLPVPCGGEELQTELRLARVQRRVKLHPGTVGEVVGGLHAVYAGDSQRAARIRCVDAVETSVDVAAVVLAHTRGSAGAGEVGASKDPRGQAQDHAAGTRPVEKLVVDPRVEVAFEAAHAPPHRADLVVLATRLRGCGDGEDELAVLQSPRAARAVAAIADIPEAVVGRRFREVVRHRLHR